ncbi:GDSL-type esterase/lipase family protein [Nocardia sp. BMG51109]|uniref:GDSL-type esterase/lipase family protein n=1 Tax=Nocardia sp. BMG51109 TaxID=1056816 RepID=UPI00068529F1|nr:GDSL-type esterase/lipase family protein [Nocardia sp. BMG51109]
MSTTRRPSRRSRTRLVSPRTSLLAATVLAFASAMTATQPAAVHAQENDCGGTHFVAAWTGSPTDAVTPLDATGGPVPLAVDDQTFRMVVTPHLGGSQLRVHLTNRFGLAPVTFDNVSIGNQVSGAAVTDIQPVLFDGKAATTVAAGADVVSDPVSFPVAASAPLAVSIHVADRAGPPTKHWNANATSYYSPAGSGDLTARPGPEQFTSTTGSWFYVNAVDVLAPGGTGAVVAFGDSITDGFVGTSPLSVPADRAVADTNGRYPDILQRRLDAEGIPISIVNAGIGSNRVLTSGEPLLLGPSGLSRFERDALGQAGTGGVLVQEGINDLGLPPAADASAMIAGYEQLIATAHRHGKKIWLGTLLPASDALVDGVLIAPRSETNRQQINAWIRDQAPADGIVDFDAALRDPADPTVLRDIYSSPDHLHPSPAGYRAMAETIDLAMLATSRPPAC